MKKKSIMKTFKLATLLIAVSLFSNNVYAQLWNGSTTSTYTKDYVGIGLQGAGVAILPATSLTVHTKEYNGDNAPSLLINNFIGSGGANSYNIVNVRSVEPFPLAGEDGYLPLSSHFIIDGDGKVGIHTQPNNTLTFQDPERNGFDFYVNGWSHFSDKVLIGDLDHYYPNIDISVIANEPNDYNLYVGGGIITEKIRVGTKGSLYWPDYVFASDYNLMPLNTLAKYVNDNKHLPGVPSASDVEKNGVELSEMSAVLLQKVEELTLYVLELKKENEELRKEVNAMKQ